jgi:hypothetical protein
MASIADVGHGASLSDYLSALRSEADETTGLARLDVGCRDELRQVLRPDGPDTTYPEWRAHEHAFYNLRAWSLMISESPFPERDSREWARSYAEMGIRLERSAPVDSVMTRDVGARDIPYYGWPYEWRMPVPSPAVHITFPDWVK